MAIGVALIVPFVFGVASIAIADPGNGNGNGNAYAYGSADANDNANNANDPHASDPNQTPSGSNGVNHNDGSEPANPDCTDSPGTSGTCSEPQPPSTADQNDTGANDTSSSNNYTSTRNGADSDNGSDNGNHTGEPCAGCVGKADNKNPQGQAPDGPTDHNNGYECDGNNGIAQTNPAHTSCTSDIEPALVQEPDCEESATQSCDEIIKKQIIKKDDDETLDSGLSSFGSSLPSAVLGESLTASPIAAPAQPVEVLGTTVSQGAVAPSSVGSVLARTGTDVRWLVLVASVLVAMGVGVTRASRRREAHA